MQTLNLTPQQLQHLKQHGSVWVWMVMKEQPEDTGFPWAFVEAYPSLWMQHIGGNMTMGPSQAIPYRLGERVECAYQKYVPYASIPVGDGVENEYGGGYETVTFFATLTTTPEPVRLDDVTEDRAVDMGFDSCCSGYQCTCQGMQATDEFLMTTKATYTDLTPDSWGWVFEIRKEG